MLINALRAARGIPLVQAQRQPQAWKKCQVIDARMQTLDTGIAPELVKSAGTAGAHARQGVGVHGFTAFAGVSDC